MSFLRSTCLRHSGMDSVMWNACREKSYRNVAHAMEHSPWTIKHCESHAILERRTSRSKEYLDFATGLPKKPLGAHCRSVAAMCSLEWRLWYRISSPRWCWARFAIVKRDSTGFARHGKLSRLVVEAVSTGIQEKSMSGGAIAQQIYYPNFWKDEVLGDKSSLHSPYLVYCGKNAPGWNTSCIRL